MVEAVRVVSRTNYGLKASCQLMRLTSGLLGPLVVPLQAELANLKGIFQKLRTRFTFAVTEWLMEFRNFNPTSGATANSIYEDLSYITMNLVPHMVTHGSWRASTRIASREVEEVDQPQAEI